MNEKVKKYLFDINKSVETIYIHLNNEFDFEKYKNNITRKRAVEREFEIIGEALNKLLSLDNEIKISNSQKIIAMRNRIIHGYDTIEDEIIWNVIINHLEKLKTEVNSIL